ncbi:MAG: DUF1549 domain-containing protein, partial [Planctomycetota bacterium]
MAAVLLAMTGCGERGQGHEPMTLVAEHSPALKQANRAPKADEPIDFNRDIRPILSDRCFACHGPDQNVAKELGGFSLSDREQATRPAESGAIPILPGKPDESELIARINSNNPNRVMPPPESHLSLTDEEKRRLTRWIEEGAEYQGHWAYQTPVRPEIPRSGHEGWALNNIDRFIGKRLVDAGLSPSPEADRATLIRRVSLDLTGLPPTPREIDAFVSDDSADAYEKVVDRLLASPHFGER